MKKIKILLIAFILFTPHLALSEDHGHDHSKETEGKHAEEEGDEHGHGGHEEAETNLSIPEKDLSRFDLTLKEVKPAHIIEGIQVSGRIVPVDEKVAHVSPRFSGVVKEVKGKVGDIVKADTLLAVIQNNQNLQTFQLYSAIPGIIIKRHATLGETVGEEDVLFIVADLSEVWAELAVYKQDVDKVRLGQKARVSIASHLTPQEGEVIFFSPITEEKTQARLARVQLKNPDPHFSPGAFVSGTIVTNEVDVPVSVEIDAIQRLEGTDNIFIRDGESFEPRKIILGQKDDVNVEVISGVKVGERYASGDTFILKAELGKSEAEHEH